MKLPDESGRAAILRRYLKPLKIEPGMDTDALVADLAAATDGASGADLEYLCQTAARLCVSPAALYCTSEGRVVCTGRGRPVCTSRGRVMCTTCGRVMCTTPLM